MKINDATYPLAERVTQVLLTYNSEKWIDRTIAHLLETGCTIVAVDNASTDNTITRLKSYPQIQVIALTKNIGAAARNEAVKAATTPYIAFCDDDTWYEKDGMEIAARLFDTYDKLAIVTGKILVGNENRLDGISIEMNESPLPETAGVPGPVLTSYMGGASLARRSAFLAVGGYDPRFFMGGEEENLAWSLLYHGWVMRYNNSVVVHHHPSLQNYTRISPYGMRNTIWTAWLHRPTKSAAKWTLHVLSSSKKDKVFVKATWMALLGMPWVLREREVLSPEHEAAIQLLRSGKAKDRRYGTSRRQPIQSTKTATKRAH